MARIRTIKPEFFTSLTIADLTVEQRLTFIGLWTHVDDEGRCVDDPRLIKAAVWPLDDRTAADVEGDLMAISESSLITRYMVNGRSFLEVNSWREHQRINRPTPSKHPSPYEADTDEPNSPLTNTIAPSTSGNEPSQSKGAPLTEGSLSNHGGLTPGKEQGTGNREQGKERAPQAERETLPASPPDPKPKHAPEPGSDDDPDWVKFWSIYPLKKSKEGARKSWRAALKKATAGDIIAGAERYRDDPGRKPDFTKHPTTWLNQGCWADEPTPAAARAQGDWRDVSGQDTDAWTKGNR